MAGTETPEYQVNVSQENLINKFAVQGEEDSRILTLHLVENVETQNALEQTEIRQKPLDLTGCTARLYVKKPDGNATFTDGSIADTGADGSQNTVTFTLTQQTLAAAGDAHCTVAVFGSNGTELKATGITLDITANDMEQTIVSTSEFVSLAAALNSVSDSAAKTTQAVTDAQAAVTNANDAIQKIGTQEQSIAAAETARVTAESNRVTAEQNRDTAESTRQDNETARQTAETARAAAETQRQTDTTTAITNAETATANANHVPQYGDNGNWESWNGTAYADSGKPWKGEKGDTGAPFTIGGSYDTLADLQAAYPSGDTKGHLVGTVPYVWDGTAWKESVPDLSDYLKSADASATYVPQTRAINSKSLDADITLTAADVSASPSSHTSETVSTESGVHGLRYYSEKLQAKDANGDWQDITTGSSGFAPKDVSGLSASAGNTQVTILWSDPPDSVVDGTTISKWAGSKLVRKEGSYPTAPTDGTLLIDNTVRDQYKTVGYADTGLTNGTTYYYAVFPYSDSGAVNTNETNHVSATPQTYVKYGVRWYKNQSSPTLERLYDSAGFTFSATNGSTAGSSDFDGKPIYKDMKLCNVQSGTVTAYEGEAGFIRDGTNGDVCVEIPKFYYQVTDTTDYRDFVISDGPLDGFLVVPRHASCSDYPSGLDKIWVGTYEASSGYKSVSGAAPLVNETRAQFRTGFSGRGAGYCQADWATQFELTILFIVETASLDSQSIVGQGNTGTSAAINTGGSDSVTGLTGSSNISSTSVAVKWRGFENLWGNVWEWRDGINFDSASSYVCLNPSEFVDNTSTNYTTLSYSKATSSGYISDIGLDSNTPWAQIPTVVSGSNSTYLCDEYYYSSGWLVACVGGSWAHDSSAGLFCLNSDYASSGCSPAFGSRLLVLPQS